MERLKILCNFLNSMFSASAGSFFALAVIWRNVNFLSVGIIMAVFTGIITYNLVKAKKEEEAKKEEK